MTIRLLLFTVTLLILAGCRDRAVDPRLSTMDALSDMSPEEAFDSLSATEYARLSDADRHYYDFLSVKIPDKAYVTHTSDSLILKVIAYESTHRGNGRYPEALYYGGRVYSDLGDYPTALKYFQEALAETESQPDIHLRGNILSQTGRLLNKLRLYGDAIPLIEEALHIDSLENNEFNLTYDHQLMGSIYLHSRNPEKAGTYFSKAAKWAAKVSPEARANMTVYLAACKLEEGNTDSARSLIRTAMDSVSAMYRNLSLAYASDIYLKSNTLDTAYIYAFELAHSKGTNNRKLGYGRLLSDGLLSLSPADSLISYITCYNKILEDEYNTHGSEQTLMQQSLYNYQIHERERIKADEARGRIIIWCLISLSLGLIIAVIFLLYRIRTKRTIIKLHETIARLDAIQNMTAHSAHADEVHSISSDPESLRKQLKQKIALIDTNVLAEPLPYDIVNSTAYRTLQKYIEDKKLITDKNPIWDKLYALILQSCPDFEIKLHMLTGGNVKKHELHTIILIKCGVTPTQMTFLLGKTKGSISSRRESIGLKILGEKTDIKTIDAIIRSL